MKISKLLLIESKGCGYCRNFNALIASMQAYFTSSGIKILTVGFDGDKAAAASAVSKYGVTDTRAPAVVVIGTNGKAMDKFCGRGFTAATLIARLKKACPECCETGACEITPVKPVVTKPTAKKPVKKPRKTGLPVTFGVMVSLLLLACGCVWTSGTFKPVPTAENPNPPTVSVRRFAILYPFEVADVSYEANGSFSMGAYKTSGGAAELVPLVDAGGKLIGSVMGTAAKTAVAVP